jgi:hypothetical protein
LQVWQLWQLGCRQFVACALSSGPLFSYSFSKEEEELQQLPAGQKRSHSQRLTYGRLLRADLPPPVTPAMKWRNVALPSRNFNGSRAGGPGAISGRVHNRRTTNQPMRQAVSNPNTEQRTTPAAKISHCALIETLPMA